MFAIPNPLPPLQLPSPLPRSASHLPSLPSLDADELTVNGKAVSLVPSEDEAMGWDSTALLNAGLCIPEDDPGAGPLAVPGHIQRQLSVRP